MPPKVSQLLTRVLAREHDDDGPSSSDSEEDDYGLQQMAANASAGLRMGKQRQHFEKGAGQPIVVCVGELLLGALAVVVGVLYQYVRCAYQ